MILYRLFSGKKNVFAYLHIRFSWILNSCSKIFSETLCDGLSPNSNTEDSIEKSLFANKSNMTLYALEDYLGKENFVNILYCTLIGLQVILFLFNFTYYQFANN